MVLSDFIFILIVFDIYSLHFYFKVYLLYVAYVNYIIKRIWYGMVWYGAVKASTLNSVSSRLSIFVSSLAQC